jgi:hypothetical protein
VNIIPGELVRVLAYSGLYETITGNMRSESTLVGQSTYRNQPTPAIIVAVVNHAYVPAHGRDTRLAYIVTPKFVGWTHRLNLVAPDQER